MSKPVPIMALLALAGCGPSPDDELLRLAKDMSAQSWECWELVRSGADLLASEPCNQYVVLKGEYDRELGGRQIAFERSFEFEVREAIGWSRRGGYFSCDVKCWESRELAAVSHINFRHTILADIGCDPWAYGNAYFVLDSWDEIRRWQADKPCQPRLELSK